MGLATRAEATDWWYITGVPELTGPYYPPSSTTYTGLRQDLTSDVLEVVHPEWPNTQTDFEVLFVLVTRPENPARPRDLANMRRRMQVWPEAWSAATGDRSSVRVHFGELDPTGDNDFDGDIDMLDFALMQVCFAGENVPVPIGPCRASDLDQDEDVDLDDFALWHAAATGLCVLPTFGDQPQSAFGCEPTPVTFTVTVEHADSLQWRRGGIDIPGATGPTLTIDPVTTANASVYSVAADNACGTVVSASANLPVIDGPHVVLYPNEVVLCSGEPVTFTLTADGAGLLSYAWTRDAIPIVGATGSEYTIDSPTVSDAGVYTVIVTDDCGATESNLLIASLGDPCGIGNP